MVSCRYVGNDFSNVGEREFSAVGEYAVFSEAGFVDAVLGGCTLIPDSFFRKVKFTQDELDEFGGSVDSAPANFLLKLGIVQQCYRDLRQRLANGEPVSQVMAEMTSVGDSENRSSEMQTNE